MLQSGLRRDQPFLSDPVVLPLGFVLLTVHNLLIAGVVITCHYQGRQKAYFLQRGLLEEEGGLYQTFI
jgi:hypothetical protein